MALAFLVPVAIAAKIRAPDPDYCRKSAAASKAMASAELSPFPAPLQSANPALIASGIILDGGVVEGMRSGAASSNTCTTTSRNCDHDLPRYCLVTLMALP